jgi:hypothetical protein
VSALQKVVQTSGHYAEHGAQLIPEDGAAFFQRTDALRQEEAGNLQKYLDAAMAAEENEFDSHPTLATRIANVPEVVVAAGDGTGYRAELSEDERRLSESYTGLLQEIRAFYGQGVQAAAPAA